MGIYEAKVVNRQISWEKVMSDCYTVWFYIIENVVVFHND